MEDAPWRGVGRAVYSPASEKEEFYDGDGKSFVVTNKLQCITGMPQYRNVSLEV